MRYLRTYMHVMPANSLQLLMTMLVLPRARRFLILPEAAVRNAIHAHVRWNLPFLGDIFHFVLQTHPWKHDTLSLPCNPLLKKFTPCSFIMLQISLFCCITICLVEEKSCLTIILAILFCYFTTVFHNFALPACKCNHFQNTHCRNLVALNSNVWFPFRQTSSMIVLVHGLSHFMNFRVVCLHFLSLFLQCWCIIHNVCASHSYFTWLVRITCTCVTVVVSWYFTIIVTSVAVIRSFGRDASLV